MILIDPRLLDKQHSSPETLRDSMSELDAKVQKILEREDVSIGERVHLFNQTLQRYMTRLENDRNHWG
jgi:hypothetical protein